MASFLHGMFLPHGESYRGAAELDEASAPARDLPLRQGRSHRLSAGRVKLVDAFELAIE